MGGRDGGVGERGTDVRRRDTDVKKEGHMGGRGRLCVDGGGKSGSGKVVGVRVMYKCGRLVQM